MESYKFPFDNPPVHWELLSQYDLEGYISLRKLFGVEVRKSKKGERLESFLLNMKQIRCYIERGDQNDWKRSIVCGIVFLSNSIAINIQQLRLLFGKCKSSINGSLQQLGYSALPPGKDLSPEFLYRIPFFRKNSSELKKWTIREIMQKTYIKPKLFIIPLPNIPVKPETETIKKIVETSFPCPAKFRHKFLQIMEVPQNA